MQTTVYKCIQMHGKGHTFGLLIMEDTNVLPAFNNVRNLGHVIVLAQAVCKTVLYSLEALSKYL